MYICPKYDIMLNIKEIMRFRELNPEPEEVTNIREKILSTFNKLQFVEESHQYFLPNSKGELIEYGCVSHITHQFVPPTDWEQVAENYAIKHGRTKEEVQEEWHYNNIKATNSGTNVHEYAESFFYFIKGDVDKILPNYRRQLQDGYLLPNSPKQEAICRFWNDIFKVKEIYPVLAETKVYTGINNLYSLKTNYAGTFDLLLACKIGGKWKLLIYDYKTNEDLYSLYNRENNKMLLAPFGDLVNENKSIYTLQLSCYELALKQLGFEIADRKIIWAKNDTTYEKISLPSCVDTLKNVL